jgi:hypothetical protein
MKNGLGSRRPSSFRRTVMMAVFAVVACGGPLVGTTPGGAQVTGPGGTWERTGPLNEIGRAHV